RRIQESPAEAGECEQEGDRKADPDDRQRQLDVLDQCGLQDVSPVLVHPARAEPVVVAQTVAPTAEVRDDGAAAVGQAKATHRSRSSRVATPSGEPSGLTTRIASLRSAMTCASASR